MSSLADSTNSSQSANGKDSSRLAGQVSSLVRVEELSDHCVVTWLVKTIEASQAEQTFPALQAIFRRHSQIVLDMAAVLYCDWFGFDGLLELLSHCPGKIRLVGVGPGLESQFVLANLRTFFSFHPTIADALSHFEIATQKHRDIE